MTDSRDPADAALLGEIQALVEQAEADLERLALSLACIRLEVRDALASRR